MTTCTPHLNSLNSPFVGFVCPAQSLPPTSELTPRVYRLNNVLQASAQALQRRLGDEAAAPHHVEVQARAGPGRLSCPWKRFAVVESPCR